MTEASEQRAPGGSTSRSLLYEARLADAAAWPAVKLTGRSLRRGQR